MNSYLWPSRSPSKRSSLTHKVGLIMLSQVCRDNYKIMRKVSHGVEFRSRPHGQAFPHMPPRLPSRVLQNKYYRGLEFYNIFLIWHRPKVIKSSSNKRGTVLNVKTVCHIAHIESINEFFPDLDQYVWSLDYNPVSEVG